MISQETSCNFGATKTELRDKNRLCKRPFRPPTLAVFPSIIALIGPLRSFADTVGRPATGRREQRGYSATSDQGTGDELTLPRTEERPAKKKSGIRRSRSTTRNQTSTPNVPTEVHKKQLFPRGRSGKKKIGLQRGRGGARRVCFSREFPDGDDVVL